MTLSALTTAFLSPTGAILMAELAAGLLILTLIVLIVVARTRAKRLAAARALLNDRESLAKAATDTFTAHCAALMPERPLSDEEQADYRERSHALIGHWVQPWLQPSPGALTHAVREIMSLRHNDLHQIAALLRQSQKATAAPEEVQQLHTELAQIREAERERSAQLAEALRSVGIIVGEYGRKFGIEADYRVPQILRALLYLQAVDQGNPAETAKAMADDSLNNLVLISEDEIGSAQAPLADQTTASEPAPTPTLASAAPEAETPPTASPTPTPPEPQDSAASEPSIDEILASMQAAPDPAPSGTPPKTEPEAPPTAKATELPQPDALGSIDLDNIDLPENPATTATDDNLNFDDIDALLDAEITRQMANKKPASDTKLPSLGDDEFDLSKKP